MRPLALGYVGASQQAERDRQNEAVSGHAREEGFALADVLVDVRDGFTISAVVAAALLHEAKAVILPAETSMAAACKRLMAELTPHGVICHVIGTTTRTPLKTATDLSHALSRGGAVRTSDGTR